MNGERKCVVPKRFLVSINFHSLFFDYIFNAFRSSFFHFNIYIYRIFFCCGCRFSEICQTHRSIEWARVYGWIQIFTFTHLIYTPLPYICIQFAQTHTRDAATAWSAEKIKGRKKSIFSRKPFLIVCAMWRKAKSKNDMFRKSSPSVHVCVCVLWTMSKTMNKSDKNKFI